MGKKENSDKVINILHSHPPPSGPSLPFSSTELKSMTESRPKTLPLKSQRSPESSVICGTPSTRLPKTDWKQNTRRTRSRWRRRRPNTRKNMARSSARKRISAPARSRKKNDG